MIYKDTVIFWIPWISYQRIKKVFYCSACYDVVRVEGQVTYEAIHKFLTLHSLCEDPRPTLRPGT